MEEAEILRRAEKAVPLDKLEAVISLADLKELQKAVTNITVDETIKSYIVDCASQTRNHPYVYLGVSPRGSLALMKACQAFALMKGRAYVTPDDVQYLSPFVFGHRMMLRPEAKYEGISTKEIVDRILTKVQVPVNKVGLR
jgi:MoxR-like ATPase